MGEKQNQLKETVVAYFSEDHFRIAGVKDPDNVPSVIVWACKRYNRDHKEKTAVYPRYEPARLHSLSDVLVFGPERFKLLIGPEAFKLVERLFARDKINWPQYAERLSRRA